MLSPSVATGGGEGEALLGVSDVERTLEVINFIIVEYSGGGCVGTAVVDTYSSVVLILANLPLPTWFDEETGTVGVGVTTAEIVFAI